MKNLSPDTLLMSAQDHFYHVITKSPFLRNKSFCPYSLITSCNRQAAINTTSTSQSHLSGLHNNFTQSHSEECHISCLHGPKCLKNNNQSRQITQKRWSFTNWLHPVFCKESHEWQHTAISYTTAGEIAKEARKQMLYMKNCCLEKRPECRWQKAGLQYIGTKESWE